MIRIAAREPALLHLSQVMWIPLPDVPVTVQVPMQLGIQPQLTEAEPQVLATHSRRTGMPLCSMQIWPSWQGAPVEQEKVAHWPLFTSQWPFSQAADTRP